jgi:hypothetical protein
MRGAARLAVLVGCAVRLDLVRHVRDQRGGSFEIGDRAIELAYGDVAMAAMPIQLVGIRVQRQSLRKGVYGVAIAPQIRLPASEPDDRLFALRVLRVFGFRLREVGFERLARVR